MASNKISKAAAISWWHSQGSGGDCLLRGVPDDPDNPPRLDDETIISLLATIDIARVGFNAILPSLLPEEQMRLSNLIEGFPAVKASLMKPLQQYYDDVQKKDVTAGVRTQFPLPNYHKPK